MIRLTLNPSIFFSFNCTKIYKPLLKFTAHINYFVCLFFFFLKAEVLLTVLIYSRLKLKIQPTYLRLYDPKPINANRTINL